MKQIKFFDWNVDLQEGLFPVTDPNEKKLVILEDAFELNGVLWIDENANLQIKPTWDCVITVNAEKKIITIQHADKVFRNEEE
ncbi:hypothetical protein PZE06_10955 [Robertmurraya sp. DFI.2.37]|uniref:hypothetical protein n=1 Tax=Robertmurraya sp. DFI.2.37 TaxID=3031819 RepID=UPI0012456AF9|nr:hypothetical protein [Robertmurraya sp. DFI.2.37]MDF1508709.1 hypothetical protein [Robertmurraya sp. DFI.2.37]